MYLDCCFALLFPKRGPWKEPRVRGGDSYWKDKGESTLFLPTSWNCSIILRRAILAFENHINPNALKTVLQGSAASYVKNSFPSLLFLSPNLCKEQTHFERNMFREDSETTEGFSWLLWMFTAFSKYHLTNTVIIKIVKENSQRTWFKRRLVGPEDLARSPPLLILLLAGPWGSLLRL